MKLVVIVPAFNEEKTIGELILGIPRKISGFDKVEVLVIDDGSQDKTVDLALNAGADKIVSHPTNLGMGETFMTGVRNCIAMNADVAVIIDADLQFDPKDIPKLTVPIINNQLDVALGSRWLNQKVEGMPKRKLIGNKMFTKLISLLAGQKFTDTQSGYVAYSREALMNLTVVNEFNFSQEAILDLKFKGFRLGEIPVSVRYFGERKSRIVKSLFNYNYKVISMIFKTLVYHKPVLTFGILGTILIFGGILAKIITVTNAFNFGIDSDLSTGFIILGIVNWTLGLFANVVFKRYEFTEKKLRDYLKDKNFESSN